MEGNISLYGYVSRKPPKSRKGDTVQLDLIIKKRVTKAIGSCD